MFPKIASAVLFILLVNLLSAVPAKAFDMKMSSSYIYFGNSSSYFSAVSSSQNELDKVYPSYFDLNSDGSLKLTSAVSQSFVDEMHGKGIKIVPFLSNHWDRSAGIAALANRAALADQIAAAVAQYNLDGVNIDLENLTINERSGYVDFINLLRSKLGAGKEISVAVAANPYGTNSGWQGSYDYAGLAANSDYLVIMAYDEHYQTGPAGPVASLPFIEKSIQYAVSKVPSEKVVLAIPFYGRIWRDGGGYPNGYGISNLKTDNLIFDYHGTRYYDSASRTSYAKIRIGAGDVKPVVGGNALAAGTYTIWYADEATTKKTLTLVKKYSLLGASSWSLGQESGNTWSYYNLWLNGCYFNDIQYHWAKNSIFTAFQNGWVNGITPSSYLPDGSLTRAQAAVMLVRALKLPAETGSAADFSDTAGHWAQSEIETARNYGIIDGVGDNRFDPDSPVTREQMAVMLYNMMDSVKTGQTAVPTFSDVAADTNSWSYDAIEAVSQKGIYTGYEDGSFRPRESLTRAQMAAILERMYKSDWDQIKLA
jgi:spore germination protein YaaH